MKQVEGVLRNNEERLEEALRIAHLGIWEWDIVNDKVWWSRELYRILGVRPEEIRPSKAAFLSIVHRDDRARLENQIRVILQDHEPFSTDHRITRGNGSVRYLYTLTCVECDEKNSPVLLYGIAQDITWRKRTEEELRVKHRVLESSINAVVITESEGYLIYVNDSTVKMWGYESRDEMLGRHLPEFWDEGSGVDGIQELYRKGSNRGVDLGKRKDGSLFPVQYATELIRDEAGDHVYMFGSFWDITEQQLAHRALLKLSGRLISAQEEERSRIARELHDDISQRMALLTMDLELTGYSHAVSYDKDLREKIAALSERLKELSSDIHRLSYRLHPRSLERLGLSVAIRSLCREISDQHDIDLDFEELDLIDSIAGETALCLFRIAQESLQNIVKHSQASGARVTLGRGPEDIRLRISDTGVGFQPELVGGWNGLGLISMRERLRTISGTLSIRSKPGEGTEIEAVIPVHGNNEVEDR